MGIVFQLCDALTDAAGDTDPSTVAQSKFFSILETFGLKSLLSSNKSIGETLLLKSKTSSAEPEKPVDVGLFLNWLQSGDTKDRVKGSSGKFSANYFY